MVFRAGVFLLTLLSCSAPALARQSAPKLDKPQRELLQAIVTAVDAAATAPDTAAAEWQTHLLRTSDGAHYVAFSVAPDAADAVPARSIVYVRLATRSDSPATTVSERSAVMEWLKGMRSDPLVAQKQRGVAFGEMPTFGAAAVASRGIGQQAADLRVLALEHERERQRREAAEKERRDTLEGKGDARSRSSVFPFEDFSTNVTLTATPQGAPAVLRRSLTAGAGDYDLYVAWAVPPARGQQPAVRVKKQRLRLPPGSATDLTLSSVIVAESLGTRETPVPPDQQTSYPYAIGSMEIVPARDDAFTNDQRLAIVFQVMNARANEAGKPDVAIGFQLFRVLADGEQSMGLLNPQFYNATTLPGDFDLTKGHPLFAAMAAPLKTLARGEYRLLIEATDKFVPRTTRSEVSFRVIATPQTLLTTAPGAPPFRREELLGAEALGEVTSRLRPAQPSAAMTTALEAARDGKFLELLRDDAVADAEKSARAVLKGIGLYALGDARIACSTLQQAEPRVAATLLYIGACRAIERNDRDAIAAWTEALAGGIPPSLAVPLMAAAHLRLGDPARAVEAAERLVANRVPAPAIAASLGAAYAAQGRINDAVALLEPHVAAHPHDLDAQYALLHALFVGFVRGEGPGATREGQEKLRTVARAYVTAKGRNAAVVSEWLGVMP